MKLCILAAGKGSRNRYSKILPKGFLPINDKPGITHIIDSLPELSEVVIAIGDDGDIYEQFFPILYPNTKFIFVKIENQILSDLKKHKVKMICLAGFMEILSRNFITKFKGKILNIHPSLLPKYKGLNTHQRALDNKEKYSGCTVHFVNSKLDSGKIILQKKVKITKNETKGSLARKVLVEEHKLYPRAILKIFNL